MKRFAKDISLFLVSMLLMACISEIILRAVLSDERKRSRYMTTRNVFHYNNRNVRFDEGLGYMMRSNNKVRFANSEFNTTISINSFGARDDEMSLVDPDIIIMGDSFAFGWGVEKNESFESVLERLTNSPVLNMGVSGYETVQEFLILRRWAGTAHRLKDRLIVFLFYPNDLVENLGCEFGSFPRIYRENGVVRFSKCTPTDYERWLRACNKSMSRGLNRFSYLASELRSFIKQTKNAIKGKKGGSPSPEESKRLLKKEDEAFELIVGEIKALTDSEGAHVIFVYCPTATYYQDRIRSIDDASIKRIIPILSKNSIPLIDLRDILNGKDYYKYDGHWRPCGHYKAALALVNSQYFAHFMKLINAKSTAKTRP